MTEILIKRNNLHVAAILLARFNMVDNEFVSVKGTFGKSKDIFVPVDRHYCLVFIPWKHREKELALIRMRDVIRIEELEGDDVIFANNYVSSYVEESPFFAEYDITDFHGYKFIYDCEGFIANVRNGNSSDALELLYRIHPELLRQEFDEE